MKQRRLFEWRDCLLVGVAIAVFGCSLSRTDSVLGGVGKRSITPAVESQPTQLGGYGDRNGEPATGIHDPALARALALRSGEELLVLVSCDMDMIPRDLKAEVVARLAERGVTAENLFIAATHTHGAPSGFAMLRENVFGNPKIGVWDETMFTVACDGVVGAVNQALDGLVPCRVGVGSETVPEFSRNRRGEGVVDWELTVLKVTRDDDSPLAMMFNYACHPTIIGPDTMVVSGGWPGAVCAALEKKTGGVALFFNGAEGDQGPKVPPSAPESVPTETDETFQKIARFAAAFAPNVQRIYDKIETQSDVPIRTVSSRERLPEQVVPPGFAEDAGAEYGLDEKVLAVMLQALFPGEIELSAFQIGGLVGVGIPGEPAATVGLQVKENLKQAGVEHGVVVGLANDYIGYILMPPSYAAGGYEATVSFYGPELGPEMVRRTSNLALKLAE